MPLVYSMEHRVPGVEGLYFCFWKLQGEVREVGIYLWNGSSFIGDKGRPMPVSYFEMAPSVAQ